uniref:Uncharacterized protein n=1 Tax=Arundo donax TaxID=35708 RepID=A0A0A9H6W9_ARUDO
MVRHHLQGTFDTVQSDSLVSLLAPAVILRVILSLRILIFLIPTLMSARLFSFFWNPDYPCI